MEEVAFLHSFGPCDFGAFVAAEALNSSGRACSTFAVVDCEAESVEGGRPFAAVATGDTLLDETRVVREEIGPWTDDAAFEAFDCRHCIPELGTNCFCCLSCASELLNSQLLPSVLYCFFADHHD